MAQQHCATWGFDARATWDGPPYPLPPGDLPSEAGVDLTDWQAGHSVSYRWSYSPLAWVGTPVSLWRVHVDAEAIGDLAEISAPMASHHDSDPTSGTELGTAMTLRERATYTSTSRVPGSIGGALDVVGLWVLYGWVRIFSMCWEPVPLAARPRPLRQSGRSDGLLGAPRQLRTPVRQLSGMR